MKMTEEINYKEFADRFYNLLKENHFYRGLPAFNEVVKEYENATKPKMTFVGYSHVEKFVYEDKDYALIDGIWYHCQKGILVFREDGDFAEELSVAHLEYKS